MPRDAITELEDPDLLKPPFDRSHKKPGGYIIKHKLEAAKARAAETAAGTAATTEVERGKAGNDDLAAADRPRHRRAGGAG